MKMTVLCVNDCAIGVYSTHELADAAATTDWERREQRHKGLERGEAYSSFGNGSVYAKYYYHFHEFEVDAEAAL